MNENLTKRILKLEIKANPSLKETFDVIGTIKAVSAERLRLESLSQIELEEELAKPTESRIIRAARTGFLNRNSQMGMVPSSIQPQTPKNAVTKNAGKDWIQILMAERRKT